MELFLNRIELHKLILQSCPYNGVKFRAKKSQKEPKDPRTPYPLPFFKFFVTSKKTVDCYFKNGTINSTKVL